MRSFLEKIYLANDRLYFPTVDLTKNVCELFDVSGTLAATYDYAPFGAVTASSPSGTIPENPLQWSSEIYDSELALVYYNYRHYSPYDGRFLSRDPIAEQGGRNLYAFVKNETINSWDLHGFSKIDGSCISISFTISYTFESKQVAVTPFLFLQVSGSINFSISGEVCKICCNCQTKNSYEISVGVSGESTLSATLGFAFSEAIDKLFSVDVWGGIQAYGGGGISGSGVFFNDCSGTHGKGVGTVTGTAGIRVGAEASFSIGKWSLGTTGVSGGGRSVVALPFNFICSDNACGSLSWGEAKSEGELYLSACAFGVCFEKTF